MIDIDTIFDNIDQYNDNIDDLVTSLKQVGIKDFDAFKRAAREAGVSINRTIQDQVAQKLDNCEENDWKEALRTNTEEAYQKYLDAYPEGQYRSEAREYIENLKITVSNSVSTEAWESVDKTSIQAMNDFIQQNPNSIHLTEAKELIKELKKDLFYGLGITALAKKIKEIQTDPRINNPGKATYDIIVEYIQKKKISVDDLLDAIKEDNNFISGAVAYDLWNNDIINDFSNTGISKEFIQMMIENAKPVTFAQPAPLEQITKKQCTEVYFWGIPSSGKTCALGAILSAANNGIVAKSMQKDNNCQGYGYMNRLSQLFSSNGAIGILPEGTAISSTYEMGFILEDEKGKEHPITCIDLAGELIRCMYKKDAGEPLTDEQENVLDTLTNILVDHRTDNRKIHFFVIECGAEDRMYEDLPQKTYLEAAVAYIQRTGIFKKDTDGLYLLITKVDKLKAVGSELQAKLKEYISNNYQGFYNGLAKICVDNEINGGKVEIQPFTLGKVCFQYYCKFNDETASIVVETLIRKSYGYKPGKLNKFLNKARG